MILQCLLNSKIILLPSTAKSNTTAEDFVDFIKKLNSIGFNIDSSVTYYLLEGGYSKEELDKLFLDIKNNIETVIGGEKFRKSFGTKPIEEDNPDYIDYIKQLIHYIEVYGLGIVEHEELPEYHNKNLTTISFITLDEFVEKINNLLTGTVVLSKHNLQCCLTALKMNLIREDIFSNIKVKENLMFLLQELDNKTILKLNLLRTVTDVLRFAYLRSNKEFLKDKKFKLKTSDKKAVMKAMERIIKYDREQALLEFKKYKSYFVALGQHIHPGAKMFSKFKNTQKVFSTIRNDRIHTINSMIENAKGIQKVVLMLTKKAGAGEVLRNLSNILDTTSTKDVNKLLELFDKMVEDKNFNIKLAIQTKKWLEYRIDNPIRDRFFNIKGKIYRTSKTLPPLSREKAEPVIKYLEKRIYNKLDELRIEGILDESLKKYIIPLEMRNFSKSVEGNIYTPGTRIPVNSRYVRLFTAWYDNSHQEKHIDVDLSAGFILEDDKVVNLGWFSQESEYAAFSGDFTSCRAFDGKVATAEFIDIDIQKARKAGVSYAIIGNFIYDSYLPAEKNNYDGFTTITGFQQLDDRTSTEGIINLEKADVKVKLGGPYKTHISIALDINTNEIVFIDEYQEGQDRVTIASLNNRMDLFRRRYLDAYMFRENFYDFLKPFVVEPKMDEEDEDKEIEKIDIEYVSENFDTLIKLLR